MNTCPCCNRREAIREELVYLPADRIWAVVYECADCGYLAVRPWVTPARA